jgi:hypothetical protein
MNKWQPWVLTLISGFAVYLFDKLIGSHIKWDQISAVPVINLLTVKIALYQIIIFLILFFILRILFRRKKKEPIKRDSIYTLKQEQLRKFKQLEMWGVLWKWDVYFDLAGKPKIDNLCPYHEHNGTPIKMAKDRLLDALVCGFPGCQAKISTGWMYSNNYTQATQLIESFVEEEWEKINTSL